MTTPPRAYYNENDPFAAAWLRNLIAAGLIADGDVDERSIEDVYPIDLVGYTQCHFFAGIGGWSYAARLAGWPDSRPLWTGSCPCQPFSAAGKRGGMSDERHLWPAFFHLIQHAKPRDVPVVGEQVASPDGLAWLDLVQADLEGAGHSVWAADICAAGFGAPIIRQRLWWIASTAKTGGIGWNKQVNGFAGGAMCGPRGSTDAGEPINATARIAERQTDSFLRMARSQHPERGTELQINSDACGWDGLGGNSDIGRLARTDDPQRRASVARGDQFYRSPAGWDESDSEPGTSCEPVGMGSTSGQGLQERLRNGRIPQTPMGTHERETVERGNNLSRLAGTDGRESCYGELQRSGEQRLQQENGSFGHVLSRPGPTNGFWRDVDWLLCRDDKWRPVEPGTQPLAHGVPNRVGRLRGFGNAINAEAAAEVLKAYMDCCSEG